MGRSQVILLLKFPEKGKVKARLAHQLGDEFAASLYRNFVLDMLSTIEDSGLCYSISFFPPDSVDSLREWLGPSLCCFPQRGSSHPERLMNTFVDAFSRGEERVMVLASDVPDITRGLIVGAVASLEKSDAVIGPSPDGGYYLIGFNRDAFRRGAFQGIAWSTEKTFSDTVSKLKDLTVHILPSWPDVDTPSDLYGLIESRRNPLFRSSRTMVFLRESGLAGF